MKNFTFLYGSRFYKYFTATDRIYLNKLSRYSLHLNKAFKNFKSRPSLFLSSIFLWYIIITVWKEKTAYNLTDFCDGSTLSKNAKFLEENENGAINIASAVDNNFLTYFNVWIRAIKKRHRRDPMNFFIFTAHLSRKDRHRLKMLTLSNTNNWTLRSLDMTLFLKTLRYRGLKHVPRVTQSRLYLSSRLPCVRKVLWVDLDALVMSPLHELWGTKNLSECGVTARTSVKSGVVGNWLSAYGFNSTWFGYGEGFNAGVMLLDLNLIRKHRFEEKLVTFFGEEMGLNDQIVYNLACNGTHGKLDMKWNVFFSEKNDPGKDLPRDEWGIIHFTGRDKPSRQKKSKNLISKSNLVREWGRYQEKISTIFEEQEKE